MKMLLLAVTLGLLLAGCSTMANHRAQVGAPENLFPRPPLPLGEFLKGPVDGTYYLPRAATRAAFGSGLDILVVSGGNAHLTRFDREKGRVETNTFSLIEFRPSLPSEDVAQQFTAGTTEADIERRLGKPTRTAYDKLPFIGIKSKDTKYARYSWFTVSPRDALTFMHVSVDYAKAKDGQWAAQAVYWDKSGGRQLP